MNILTSKEINKALLLKDTFSMKLNSLEYQLIQNNQKGNLFIPIKGKNYDGHNYIGEAFEKGLMLH